MTWFNVYEHCVVAGMTAEKWSGKDLLTINTPPSVPTGNDDVIGFPVTNLKKSPRSRDDFKTPLSPINPPHSDRLTVESKY